MAVAAQITLTPLNFHIHAPRSRPLFRRASLFFSFLWLAFSLFRCVTTFMHLLFLQKTCRLANRHTHTRKLTHTHTKPNIIENQNFKVNTAAVWQQERGMPGAIEELLLNNVYLRWVEKKVINLNLIQIKICILWLKKICHSLWLKNKKILIKSINRN